MPFDDLTSLGLRTPLTVRNNEPNVTIFAKTVNGDMTRVTFGAAGTATAEQRVPLQFAEDIDFLNALEQGVLTVVGGPANVVEILRSSADEARRSHQATLEAQATAMVDRAQDRDIVGLRCVGPAPFGRDGSCGRQLLQSAKAQGEHPPLCPEHEHLAPTFHLVEVGSKGYEESGASESTAGIVRREWKQAVITAPQRGDQQ